MEKSEKFLSLKTTKGSFRLLCLFLILVFVFSWLANMIITKNHSIEVTDVVLDVRGGDLHMELYRPSNADSTMSYPCVLMTHGGSESLAADSMMAWELARRGFVVLNISAYGAGLSDQPNILEDGTTGMNGGSYNRGATMGVWDAYQYALSLEFVDPTRISAWAHSTGRHLFTKMVSYYGQNLTLNDRLINVLHDDFGIEFAEDEILQDADEVARAKLNDVDYGRYLEKKAEQEDIVSKYLKAARLTERAYGVKANVAGYTVIRDPQMNLLIGLGTHELSGKTGSYYLGETDQYKKIFHVSSGVERNNWYDICDYIHDPSAESTKIGDCFDTTINNSKSLKEACEKGTARLFLSPVTMHNGNLWSWTAVSEAVEFYCQTMGWNNGELTDPATKPIDSKNCVVGYSALIMTTLSFVAMIGAVISIASLILSTTIFNTCKNKLPEARMELKGMNFMLYLIATTIAGFAGAYGAQMADQSFVASNKTMSLWLPWEPGQMRTFFMLGLTAGVGLVLYLLLGLIGKKKNNQSLSSVKEMRLGCGGVLNVIKNLFIAVVLFVACYTAAVFINTFFDSRFLMIDGAFELMKGYSFGRMARYFIIILPCTLIISTLNNMVSFKGVNDSVDTLLNVVFTSLGMALLIVIAYVYTYSGVNNGDVLHIQCILSLIPLVPICNYLYRKLYKLTGSPWLGAFFVAILIAWRCAGYISHQFMWYGNNERAAFWGIY
ncbi:MAG: hypothetical protein MSA93_01120 [Spirochaetales bacterium]|nr:hypothetical protein [Spirochaetales bacterium]